MMYNIQGRAWLTALVAMAIVGCSRGSAPPTAKSEAKADSSAVALPPASRTVPQQLVAEQQALASVLEAGTLDQVGVHAFRLRDLTRALAASDAKRFAAAADSVRASSESLQAAAEKGDLGEARARFTSLNATLAAFRDAPDVAQLEIPTQTMDSRSVTLTGELIDPQCYFTHDGRGIDHVSCATMCAKGGQDLAFLDAATGDIHPLIAVGHGEDPNRDLLPHIGQAITIEGVLFSRAHNRYLLIQQVVGAATAASTATPEGSRR